MEKFIVNNEGGRLTQGQVNQVIDSLKHMSVFDLSQLAAACLTQIGHRNGSTNQVVLTPAWPAGSHLLVRVRGDGDRECITTLKNLISVIPDAPEEGG